MLDDARAGKADKGLWLGDIDIPEHGKTGGNAAHGRVRQHRDIRDTGLRELCQGRAGFGHLHQGEQGFLHTGATTGGKAYQGPVLLKAKTGCTDETFADHGAHGTTHEPEFKGRGHDRNVEQGALHGNQRIFFAGYLLCLADAVLVFFAVPEFQNIIRLSYNFV